MIWPKKEGEISIKVARGRLEQRLSIRSRTPPCPGIKSPLSLTLAILLIYYSNRSPSPLNNKIKLKNKIDA